LRNYHSVIVIAFLSVLAGSPAHAETDLTGKWTGTFSGVQVEFPPQRGPFGQTIADGKKGSSAPRFVENPLQLEFDSQKNGLTVGTWTAGEFKQRFVCALVSSTMWNCVDAGGRASIEVRSATEIKVCYLDNREGAQGAGCGLLKKAR
jgi:hypothetical protein